MRRKPKRNVKNKRKLSVQTLESRRLLAADSIGVTPEDTAEFLLGTVAVTPVFFESDGTLDPSTEDWTENEIDEILDKVHASVDWWSDTLDELNTVHTLDFVVDDLFARDPVETPYEPITRPSSQFNRYVGDFLISQGYGDASSIEDGVRQFNHAQRLKHQTDWAFTIFVLDSSNDLDGVFPRGSEFTGAFAYPGGLFYVTPSTRPTSTYTHELGHIFWARDEYNGGAPWASRRGYYNTQNLNSVQNNPDPNFVPEPSIMQGGLSLQQAFEQNRSPASTLAMVGWQDSDGDGIFDVADVPLSLDAVGHFDPIESVYRFQGTASAKALINQNPSGTQSDITLNRISEIQYRLDDGPWMVAAAPDQPVVDFDLSIEIGESDFTTIHWRAIDQAIGVVSPTITGTASSPAASHSSLSGIAFIDQNVDQNRDLGDSSLASSIVTVSNPDGSPLFSGELSAAEFPEGDLSGNQTGVTITADGTVFDTKVASLESVDAGNVQVFQSFNLQQQRYTERWSSTGAAEVAFSATIDQTVGNVYVDVIGLDTTSFARLEAFDSLGNLIGRTTSEAITTQENLEVSISDSLGRISEIRVTGHAGTAIAISGLRFGHTESVTTDASGVWQVANLPDGSYRVDVIPELVIHEFPENSILIEVEDGSSEVIVSAAVRIDSLRHNESLPADTNRDGVVDALDALVVINDISRNDTRVLSSSDTSGDDIDVSNDGIVSALDALLVINRIAGQASSSSSGDPEVVDLVKDPSGQEPSLPGSLTRSTTANAQTNQQRTSPSQTDMLNFAGNPASEGGLAPAESIDASKADDRNDGIETKAESPDPPSSLAEIVPATSGANARFSPVLDASSPHDEELGSSVSQQIEEPFEDLGIKTLSAESD
jgi:hypothetical protein